MNAANGPLGGHDFSEGGTWVDALAGGGSSDWMWDLWGGVGCQVTDQFSALVGYCGTGVRYDNGDGFLFDVVEQGPVVGAVYRF